MPSNIVTDFVTQWFWLPFVVLVSHNRMLAWVHVSLLLLQLLANLQRRQQKIGPYGLCGRSEWNSRFLISSWVTLDIETNWRGNQKLKDSSVSFLSFSNCCSAFYVNKQKKIFFKYPQIGRNLVYCTTYIGAPDFDIWLWLLIPASHQCRPWEKAVMIQVIGFLSLCLSDKKNT